jgi:formate hydrogenlyase subunit 6/NADH:ubiquinone oxidoreductase subunit I
LPFSFELPSDILDDMAMRSRHAPAPPTWQGREIPLLDERLCTGCGLCCALCPVDCLEMAGPLPWLPRPAACISCAVCQIVCPANALKMAMLADEEEGLRGQGR